MTFEESFSRVARSLGKGPVSVTLGRYSELKHTWKSRGGNLEFKVSDYLADASDEVKEALAWHLLYRAHSVRCPDGRDSLYLSYSRSKQFWQKIKETYLGRARNLEVAPAGQARDLRVVFDYVNSFYFSGRLRVPTLAWTTESPRQRLGFYFEQLDLLAINKAFDSEHVPRYALEFVMYHELLHHRDAESGRMRRRVHHTRSFREQERAFRMCPEAEAWLRRIARSRR